VKLKQLIRQTSYFNPPKSALLVTTAMNRYKAGARGCRRAAHIIGLSLLVIVLQCVASPGFSQPGKTEKMILTIKPDSAKVHISGRYGNPGLFKKIFLGKNYREEWSTPVMLPVLNLSALHLNVKEIGGGKQTKSLQLVDNDSTEWALRMIDKDVKKALPSGMRNPVVRSIVQDLVSAAHPYAPLAIPPLGRAAGVTVSSPRFYWVPGDPLLGKYRNTFAGTVCLLERRDVSAKITETENTKHIVGQLLQSHKYAVSQKAYLKARLLDMLIGDWDRHYDQWKWAEKDSGDRNYYWPLPKDRDQAFFYSGGLLVRLAKLLGAKPIVGFTAGTSNIVSLNAVGWTMDMLFLNQLSYADWKGIAEKFQKDITDEAIKQAVKKLPPEIYPIHGATLTRKLVSRRNSLAKDVLSYYRFLARSVTVFGTDEGERFVLSGNRDSITLIVLDATRNQRQLYRRTFYSKETKEIYLLGLGGDDEFVAAISGKTKIHLHVDGGKGKNQYDISGQKKIKVCDSEMDAACCEAVIRKQLRVEE
jgi:hypothetical protein